jgi:ADP-ribose pyrophosphatase YjhB (NUDIX family)
LEVALVRQFHTYSEPQRDPRHHTITTVYIANAKGRPVAGDDAAEAVLFSRATLPEPIVFDHKAILNDYFTKRY